MADALQLPEITETLTDKQEAWVSAYLGPARFNATEAARLAGYSDCEVSGWENKKKPAIRARVRAHLDALNLTAEEIIAELGALAMAPSTHFMQILQAEYTDESGRKHPAIIRQDLSAKVNALKTLAQIRGLLSSVDVNVKVETKTIIGISLEDVYGKPREESPPTGHVIGSLAAEVTR